MEARHNKVIVLYWKVIRFILDRRVSLSRPRREVSFALLFVLKFKEIIKGFNGLLLKAIAQGDVFKFDGAMFANSMQREEGI